MYMYIYICRERERERDVYDTCVYTCIYVYIYIERERDCRGGTRRKCGDLATLAVLLPVKVRPYGLPPHQSLRMPRMSILVRCNSFVTVHRNTQLCGSF